MRVEIDSIQVTTRLDIALSKTKDPRTRELIADAINYIGKQVKLKQQENEEMEQMFRKGPK